MRLIKFRGQRVDNGEWVYGYYIRNRIAVPAADGTVFCYYEVLPETVGQFAGLINDIEIWEGDIVLWTRKHWHCPGNPDHNKDLKNRMYIFWDDEEHAFRVDMYDERRCIGSSGLSFEDERANKNVIAVIGNIHQHPELLEQSK